MANNKKKIGITIINVYFMALYNLKKYVLLKIETKKNKNK